MDHLTWEMLSPGVARLSGARAGAEHSSYQARVWTGRVCHVWQCPLLARCADDVLYSWSIGHRDGDADSQTQLGRALLSVFVLIDLEGDDTGEWD